LRIATYLGWRIHDDDLQGTDMLHLIKRLLPREPLPAHIHFHVDGRGNRVWCDESICRPSAPSQHPLYLPRP
jgi:hypothetical protein